jgi:hypothetical protein
MTDSPLIASLAAAVDARPDDVPLRLHLAGLLLDAGRQADAIAQIGRALAHDPGNADGHALMQRALGGGAPPPAPAPAADPLAEYERELSDIVAPRFARADREPDAVAGEGDRIFDVETSTIRLADVGGMTAVKERLELAFLGPLRNPEMRKLYGKSLRGGLMLYGPPGCGKTFLARAIAGEMGAKFLSLSIVDVLDLWMGNSERNLH